MRTLLIDNYDSFTFNLFQYLAEINGEAPLVIRNDEMSWSEVMQLDFDNLVISPGPGRPDVAGDFGVCWDAILRATVPVLGVCLGHQGIGCAFGGRVMRAPKPMHGRLSEVFHDGEAMFRGLTNPLRVVRYHSLAVASPLPPDLRASAWTRDGVLMGLTHRTKPIWGVQFHPESVCTNEGIQILRNFRDISDPPCRAAVSLPSRSPLGIPEDRRRMAVQYRRIAEPLDAESAFVNHFAASTSAVWLHSASVVEGVSRFSFMGDASGPMGSLVSYYSSSRRLEVRRGHISTIVTGSIFDYLNRELRRNVCSDDTLPFDFIGGFVGYFGYELLQECGGLQCHGSSYPDAMFAFLDRLIVFDHVAQDVYLVALSDAEDTANAVRWLDQMAAALRGSTKCPPPGRGEQDSAIAVRMQQGKATYLRNIREAINQIEAGETYEVCLTNKLFVDRFHGDSLDLYRVLYRTNPAPFAAFLRFDDIAVASSSPERFLRINRQRIVEARPIKGTAKRSADPDLDRQYAVHLGTDEKNRSENLMIVDLLRNDLGRVCEIGTVAVPSLMQVETYATLHQLVTTITGKLKEEHTTVDCIRAAFPGGSMTGAPKIRTMQIVDRLEAAPRGIYSGAIGYLSLNQTADLSIVIRTIVCRNQQLELGVGGAIVALSDPEAEFAEIMLKAEAPLRAIATTQRRAGTGGSPYRIIGADESTSPFNDDAAGGTFNRQTDNTCANHY